VGHGDGRWAHDCGIYFFNSFATFFAESHLVSRHMCAVEFYSGSRCRALCRPSSAEWLLPRVPSWCSLCREESDLCGEQLALDKAMILVVISLMFFFTNGQNSFKSRIEKP
jgi:hypothetical protein